MATASNIDYLQQKRNQHLDNIKFITKDIDDYQQSNKHNVSVLKKYKVQLEGEWKRFRLVQEELYDLDEEENTQEREAFGYYISLAARIRNLIEGRRPSTLSTPTGSRFPARSSSDNTLSSTTDNSDHLINANNTDSTDPHKKRFQCPRHIALRHSLAIVNFPKITETSPTALMHLINTVKQNLRSLSNLGEPINLNTIIISLISSKLPAKVVQEWQLTLPNKEVPQYAHLLSFLRRLVCSLKWISRNRTTRQTCPICRGPHKIWRCDSFKAKSVSERLKDVKAASLCTNCLGEGHFMVDCYAGSCRICGQWHNTMLHKDKRHSGSRFVTSSQTFSPSSSRSSRPSSTSSSPTRHQKSTTKHKSETSRRDSSPGPSSSHRRTRKQWCRQATIPMTTEPIKPLASNSLYSAYHIQISVLNDKQQSIHCPFITGKLAKSLGIKYSSLKLYPFSIQNRWLQTPLIQMTSWSSLPATSSLAIHQWACESEISGTVHSTGSSDDNTFTN